MERSPIAPSLYVPDVAAAVTFYTHILGFSRTGIWMEDETPLWAEVALEGPKGTARIWFFNGQIDSRPGPALSGLLYLFVGPVDAEAARCQGKVKVLWRPEDQKYGLRELGIEDLNGYILCFAEDI
jgi:catechol 2,3-dioxygenase-like lactoylglutathione lyase family enzyme